MSCPHGNDPETCSWCLQPNSADEYVKKMQERDRELDAIHAECLRVERWHETYNAALTKLAAKELSSAAADYTHDRCILAADKAHGPLNP